MKKCKFCGETLSEPAKKCRSCGEPQGWHVYGWGMILKYIPLLSALSVLVALGSLYIAYLENQATRRARAGEERAQQQVRVTTARLDTVERAASRAMIRLRKQLPESAGEDILRSLELRNGTTERDLEANVGRAPLDVWEREKLFLYRAFKEP